MRAQLVTGESPVEFQEILNLEYQAVIKNGWTIIDTKFSTSISENQYIEYSALIIYNENKE